MLCMIAEYHLTSQVQGMPNLSPVVLEVAAHLLPPVEDYVGGRGFQGTRDMRVVKRARTLGIATWLHCLDMAVQGDVLDPQTLEPAWHVRGPLLDMLLTPRASNLTFKKVVNCVLEEDRSNVGSSLTEFRVHHARIQEELEGLVKAHSDVSNKDT